MHLPQNLCRLIRRPKPPRGRDPRLGPDEEQRLLDAADAGRNPFMRALIIIALETGMRQGELLGFTWSYVDVDRRIAHLSLTKNGDARDARLSTRALTVLKALPNTNDGKQDFSTTKSAVGQAWLHLRQRVGSPDLHFHDMRREAVTRLLERGCNVIEVSTVSGHRELKMLQRYSHLRAEDLVDRLG